MFEVNTIAPLKFIEALYTNMRHGSYKRLCVYRQKWQVWKTIHPELLISIGPQKPHSIQWLKSKSTLLKMELRYSHYTRGGFKPIWAGPMLYSIPRLSSRAYGRYRASDMSSTGKFLNYDGTHCLGKHARFSIKHSTKMPIMLVSRILCFLWVPLWALLAGCTDNKPSQYFSDYLSKIASVQEATPLKSDLPKPAKICRKTLYPYRSYIDRALESYQLRKWAL